MLGALIVVPASAADATSRAAARDARAQESSGHTAEASWLQWGGPDQDFRAPAKGLAASWPEQGPPTLWQRELGAGYSAILYEDSRLYTMYRSGDREVVVCLDSGSGETIWEYRYEAAYEGQPGYGIGPRSTPLIADGRLFTVSVGGALRALDKGTGRVLWKQELWGAEFGGNFLSHGYSSSPIAWRDLVIVPVGGENAGLVAFDQGTGRVAWRAHDFRNSFSSPRIVEVLGEDQLVIFMAEEIIGVAPDTGELRWRFPQINQWRHNITLPTVVDGDTVVISSPQAGALGLRLIRNGGTIEVERLWSERRIQFYHASSVRDGDWVYGSTGMASPAFMAAINLRTGEIGWRQRGFAKANCVEADGRLLILDEEGILYLTTASPEGIEVHSQAKLLHGVSWTVPTVVGRTLYVRDQTRILAVDLGQQEPVDGEALEPQSR